MTVYMVTTGEDDDYSVHGMFSTREKAEAFVATSKAECDRRESDWNIEEWPVDAHDSQKVMLDYYWTINSKLVDNGGRGEKRWRPIDWTGDVWFIESKVYEPGAWTCSAHSPISPDHARQLVIEKLQEVQRQQALTK